MNSWFLGRGIRDRRRVRNMDHRGNIHAGDFNIVIVGLTHVEPHLGIGRSMVVAGNFKTIAQGNLLRRPHRKSRHRERASDHDDLSPHPQQHSPCSIGFYTHCLMPTQCTDFTGFHFAAAQPGFQLLYKASRAPSFRAPSFRLLSGERVGTHEPSPASFPITFLPKPQAELAPPPAPPPRRPHHWEAPASTPASSPSLSVRERHCSSEPTA